ncbi:hypothetical protein ACNFIA_27905 [Pseudomonas sp. NY15437]|uniref:hypothetical protein n=1 Tax=Pseudomonas TaxID=286 RepID=UPI0007EE4AD5|nr:MULTISPECIES: hypothetical protein [Pseudomonas]NMZ76654.1 hypothetical protein [Pseudomonas nitroreducens]OBY48952.1 hypothetical protein A9513_031280 [Pseudomonas sp. AU12215]
MSAAAHALDHRKSRISQIAAKIVESRVARGEINPGCHAAMDAACHEAVLDAKQLYDAAVEFVS